MLNAKRIQTEAELQRVLAQCGFASDAPTTARSWHFWQREWRRRPLPIACYLLDFPYVEFFVAINDGAIQIYEQDQQNFWFHLVGEILGDVSAEELAARLRIMTQGGDILERRLALRLRQGIK
jgi:hypothetical protein